MKKILFIAPLLILLFAAGFVWWRYYYVFGEGIKSGELNFVVNKGYVFKTYEGKLIMSGFKSTAGSGATIQSNEFVFSIENEEVAKQLMSMGGRSVDVYYKEYLHPLPWRGNSEFVVDRFVVKIENISLNKTNMSMYVGGSATLNAAVFPEDASAGLAISWKSSNPAVATVNSEGLITAVASGQTTIYATAENKTTSCSVIVYERNAQNQQLPQHDEPAALPQNSNSDPQEVYDPIEADKYLQRNR